MKIEKIISMLDGYQFNRRISAFLIDCERYFLRTLAIGDEITFVIPPPYFMIDIPITLPKEKSRSKEGIFKFLVNKTEPLDLFNHVKNLKDLNDIFEEYIRSISLNTISKDLNSELNKVRAWIYKDYK